MFRASLRALLSSFMQGSADAQYQENIPLMKRRKKTEFSTIAYLPPPLSARAK
jgi:hypothetical protein